MDNIRKRTMITKVCDIIVPIYQFLAINNDRKNLTIIDNAIETELKKADSTTDDEFYNKIICNLQGLSLPNDYKLAMYKFMTLSQIRDKIVNRLKKEMSGQDNKKKHWYEETEE